MFKWFKRKSKIEVPHEEPQRGGMVVGQSIRLGVPLELPTLAVYIADDMSHEPYLVCTRGGQVEWEGAISSLGDKEAKIALYLFVQQWSSFVGEDVEGEDQGRVYVM